MTNASPDYKKLIESGVVSKPYASQIASGKRSPSIRMAIAIYRATGLKFGDFEEVEQTAAERQGAAE